MKLSICGMAVLLSLHSFILLRGLAREAGHWGDFKTLLEEQSFCNKVYALDLPCSVTYRKYLALVAIGGHKGSELLEVISCVHLYLKNRVSYAYMVTDTFNI